MPPDMDKFRLRRFVEKLDAMGEVEIHKTPTNLSDIAVIIENCPKVVWFKNVGPEMLELVANVNGSQKRLAVAMGVSEGKILDIVNTYEFIENDILGAIDAPIIYSVDYPHLFGYNTSVLQAYYFFYTASVDGIGLEAGDWVAAFKKAERSVHVE